MNDQVNLENFDKLDIVKKYFSREFTVLSGEIRERLKKLNINEKEKKNLTKELVFLTKKRQQEMLEFLESLSN